MVIHFTKYHNTHKRNNYNTPPHLTSTPYHHYHTSLPHFAATPHLTSPPHRTPTPAHLTPTHHHHHTSPLHLTTIPHFTTTIQYYRQQHCLVFVPVSSNRPSLLLAVMNLYRNISQDIGNGKLEPTFFYLAATNQAQIQYF